MRRVARVSLDGFEFGPVFKTGPEPELIVAREGRGTPESGADAQAKSHRLCDAQRCFALALMNPEQAVPRGWVGPDRKPDVQRFNVYRNNVIVGLVDALASAYPCVRRIVGEAFFSAMARIYVASAPPESPVMLEYGATFARFIDTFEPASGVPYLSDVARLERARVEAYHSAEAPCIDIASLYLLDPRILPGLSLILHPSVRIVESVFPVVELWRMNLEGGTPGPIDIDQGGEHAFVSRAQTDVEVRRVNLGVARFVRCLVTGTPVEDAARSALEVDPDFDLAVALEGLFGSGAVVGWSDEALSHSSPTTEIP